ncbi:hypothetical protein MY04_4773 [Flammeovirga sp. MY04]|uniref:hypothetical protein n=1 Tax=Flammeovirga sp. MY04 TaxID=1191459 RepID=UPI00080633F0|nr:hypothetical protein [Flammeovirga sp. MY04]ANQ49590.1 hypothetical protein MY04_2216 [Flammeovirga sp. MY04]ANQ52108.1 hypothetical protein MY04_4773 [Flammeovirga sp. MY04]
MSFDFFNNKLCVESTWLYGEADIISQQNYKNLKRRDQIVMAKGGGNGRKAYVYYETLPQRFRDKIEEKFGDPHKIYRRNSFFNFLEIDNTAKKFFDDYTFDSDNGKRKALPEAKRIEYTANASVLNAIKEYSNFMMAKRQALGGRKGKLWEKISDVVADLPRHTWAHNLPKNTRRLRERLDKYIKGGYEVLIHRNFCNNSSSILTEDARMWLFAKWSNQVKRVTSVPHLWELYNEKAEEEGWKTLKDERAIRSYLYQPEVEALWITSRRGSLAAKAKFDFQHSTKMASKRDMLWYADGTKLNYYYLDADGNMKTMFVYEVMDAYSEVLLGYSFAKTENYEMQYGAFKMAAQISGRRPYELKFDGQGGHKKLQAGNLLTKIARLSIKTKPYNGASKTIESAFGRFQQRYLKQDWFFTGQNITATSEESKKNEEFILANKANLPTEEEVKEIYKQRREEWNNAPHHVTGIPRAQMYRESENEKAVELSIWDMVDLFWIERPNPVTMTNQGIILTEKGEKRQYAVMNGNVPNIKWLDNNMGRKFYIKYDPENPEYIKLYTKDALGLEFKADAELKPITHRAVQDQEAWESEYYKKVQSLVDQNRLDRFNKAEEILAEFGMRAEDQGLNTPKVKGVKNPEAKTKKVSKRKVKETSIGEAFKEVSNMDTIPLVNKNTEKQKDDDNDDSSFKFFDVL